MRCFVAAWPPPGVLTALANLRRPETVNVRWSARDQWHVTLRFFGELSPDDVERATTALVQVAAASPRAVELAGGPSTRFLGPRLLVWPVEGLSDLAGKVESATARIGEPPPSRRFSGHLTLARTRGTADIRRERGLLQPLEMSWSATAISLVQSRLGPKGASYSELAEFPLGAGARERKD